MLLLFVKSVSTALATVSPSVNQTTPLEWLQSPLAIIVFSVVIPLLTWLFTPQYVRQKLMLILVGRKKINTSELGVNIKKLNLGICNESRLSMEEFVHSHKYVFFPVVPNKSPNIIHITFINAIKGLEKLGLYVFVFIYDDYFSRVKDYSLEKRKTYISNFTKRLQDMGIRKNQIIFESDIIKSKFKARKMLTLFLSTASKLSVNDIDELAIVNKHYVKPDTKYIRKFKSVLNIVYPMCISSKIGFVLSGEDEKKLWETYVNNIDNDIVHLYIPSIYNNDGILGNILDEDNLSYEDTIESLKDKISKFLLGQRPYNIKSNIFYLLDNNYFNHGKHIEINDVNGSDIKISSTKKLVEFCNANFDNDDIKRKTLDILSQAAYNIFRKTKGE